MQYVNFLMVLWDVLGINARRRGKGNTGRRASARKVDREIRSVNFLMFLWDVLDRIAWRRGRRNTRGLGGSE
jgi:hypothetical protein